MDSHQNARTTPHSRAEIVRRMPKGGNRSASWPRRSVSASARCGNGRRGTRRPRRPAWSIARAGRTGRPARRRRPWWPRSRRCAGRAGPAARIAPAVALSRATVGRLLRRLGLARLRALAPAEPVRRYERARPGRAAARGHQETRADRRVGHRITGDRRHRARGIGWEYVHVAIDDCSRLSYVEVLGDERGETVAAFLRRALRWFARRGVRIERVLSDNGSAYRSRVVAAACQALRVAQRWTRPVPAPDQRQGRALHPDAAPRVGLRPPVRQLVRPPGRAAGLVALLQLAPPPWRPSRTSAHQPSGPGGQSREPSHLVRPLPIGENRTETGLRVSQEHQEQERRVRKPPVRSKAGDPLSKPCRRGGRHVPGYRFQPESVWPDRSDHSA